MKKIFTPLFAFIVVVITVAILVIDELDYVEIQALYPAPQEIMHNLQPEEDLYIVNFLASWCPSCEKELKYFGLIKTYMDIPIYGIVVNDTQDNIEKMLGHNVALFKKLNFTFPMVRLAELNIERIPRIMMIYKNNVIYDHTGEINERIINKKIVPIITQLQNLQNQDKELNND